MVAAAGVAVTAWMVGAAGLRIVVLAFQVRQVPGAGEVDVGGPGHAAAVECREGRNEAAPVRLCHGTNVHHIIEAAFKGLARCLRDAVRVEGTGVPSTKGVL